MYVQAGRPALLGHGLLHMDTAELTEKNFPAQSVRAVEYTNCISAEG